MKYYIYDNEACSWSEELYTLPELLVREDLDDSSFLATEDGMTTLTLGEAKAGESMQPASGSARPGSAPAGRPRSLNLVVSPRPVASPPAKIGEPAPNPGSVAANIVKNMKLSGTAAVMSSAKPVKLFGNSDNASNGQVIKEYKVLSQKDKWYSGKFDPDMLEKALNDYARMGYQVICSSTATIQGFTGAREEMIIILERDKQ